MRKPLFVGSSLRLDSSKRTTFIRPLILKKLKKKEENLVRGIFLEARLLGTHHIYKASDLLLVLVRLGLHTHTHTHTHAHTHARTCTHTRHL